MTIKVKLIGDSSMKKRWLLLLVILMGVSIFVGCNSKSGTIPTDEKYHEAYDTQYNFKVTPIPVSIMNTENGLYEITDNKLYYVENGEKVIMCNKPDCTHDISDGCEALAMQYAQIESYNDRICYLYENNGKIAIMTIKKDGSDRKELLTLDDYDSIISYIIHRGKLIFIYQNSTDKINDSGIVYENGVAVCNLQDKTITQIMPNRESVNSTDSYDGLTAYGNTVYFFENSELDGSCTLYEYSLADSKLSTNQVSQDYPVYEMKWITEDYMYLTYPDLNNMKKILIQSDRDGQNVKEMAESDLFDDIYTNGNYILIKSNEDSKLTIYDMNFTKLSESDVTSSDTDYIVIAGFDNNTAYFKGETCVRILELEHPEKYIEVD